MRGHWGTYTVADIGRAFAIGAMFAVIGLLVVRGKPPSEPVVLATPISITPVRSLDALAAAVKRVPPHHAGFHGFEAHVFKETPERLELARHRLGAKVETVDLSEDGLAGRVTGSTREVELHSGMVGDVRDLVLAHELAHLLQPRAMTLERDKEVFAEAVAYLVGNHEADYTDFAAAYLAKHKAGIAVLDLYRDEIQFAADFIWGSR